MSGDRVDRGPLDAPLDHSRRRLLTAATAGFGAVGVAFAAVPFISSWQPSVRAKALGAPVSVDASKLEDGQMLKISWRGQPVFVVRRSKAVLDSLGGHNDLLADPNSNEFAAAGVHQGCRTGARAKPRVLGGIGGLHASRLLSAGRVRAQQRIPGRGHGSRTELAGRFLLPVSRLEVRHLRPGIQEHAGTHESDRSFLHVLGRCADRDR